jgi:hypothetical protein
MSAEVSMKRLTLASIFCLAFAARLRAQAPAEVPKNRVWQVLQGVPQHKFRAIKPQTGPEIILGDVRALQGVCSVPLLEAHVNLVDPKIAIKPSGHSVAMPQANVPAPACEKH